VKKERHLADEKRDAEKACDKRGSTANQGECYREAGRKYNPQLDDLHKDNQAAGQKLKCCKSDNSAAGCK